MLFHQEDGSPYVVRSRYYRLNPHFRPATVAGDVKQRKPGFFRNRGKWFWIEAGASVTAILILAVLILFPNEIDAWVRRHFPPTTYPVPPHEVATFHDSNWTPAYDRSNSAPAPMPPPAH